MRAKHHVAVACVLLLFVSLACKVGKTPPLDAATTDAAPADVVAEIDQNVTGACSRSDRKCLLLARGHERSPLLERRRG